MSSTLRPLKVLLRAGAKEARAYSTTNSSSPQDVRNAVHHLEDTVSLTRVRGLANTLELPTAPESRFKHGSKLPPPWSLLLFPPVWTATSSLSPVDGCEPSPLHLASTGSKALERMWVAGSFSFPAPPSGLLVGEKVSCEARVTDVKERVGKDGRKGWYVETERVMRGHDSGSELVETRTHLYRYPLEKAVEPAAPEAKPTKPEAKETDWRMDWTSNDMHLFRFSALTFNTHRIHWDREYCVQVEKRKGLVVHGPLTALLTAYHANDAGQQQRDLSIRRFEYRNTSPMVVGTPVSFCGRWKPDGEKGADLWVSTQDGASTFLRGRCEYH